MTPEQLATARRWHLEIQGAVPRLLPATFIDSPPERSGESFFGGIVPVISLAWPTAENPIGFDRPVFWHEEGHYFLEAVLDYQRDDPEAIVRLARRFEEAYGLPEGHFRGPEWNNKDNPTRNLGEVFAESFSMIKGNQAGTGRTIPPLPGDRAPLRAFFERIAYPGMRV